MAKGQRVKNIRKAVVNFSGFAAEIWERLPRGIRSNIVARLLEEAYHCGRLDLVLTRPLEDRSRTAELQPKTRRPVLQRREEIRETRGWLEEHREQDSQEEPDWLQDLDRKISETIKF